MYHSNVILGVATGASNSELMPKRFLFNVITLCDDYKKMHKLLDYIELLCRLLNTPD